MQNKTYPETLYDHNTEQTVLTIFYENPETMDDTNLTSLDFHDSDNANLFAIMQKIRQENGDINDIPYLVTRLKERGTEIPRGKVTTTLGNSGKKGNLSMYVEKIATLSQKRKALSILDGFASKIKNGGCDDIAAFRDDAIRALRDAIETPEQLHEKTSWTVAELLDTEFPEMQWVIPDLIPQGLVYLAGRPKLGKSWLALQIAHAVGTGGMLFDRKVEQGNVLFLALEDPNIRLQSRIKAHKIPRDAKIKFERQWPIFGHGGMSKLQDAVIKNEYTLVIIDTLTRAAGKLDQLDHVETSYLSAELQGISQNTNATILVIDHHNKLAKGNPIDDILGSTGKSGVIDTALGLYRDNRSRTADLLLVGRDIESQELELEWDGLTLSWQVTRDTNGVSVNSIQDDILSAIEWLQEQGETATTTTIAKFLEKGASNVSRELAELINKGIIVKGEKVGKLVPYLIV